MGFSSVPLNFLKDAELLLLKGWTRSIFPIPPTKHRLKPWTLYIKQTQDSEREECRLARDLKTQEMTQQWVLHIFSLPQICLTGYWRSQQPQNAMGTEKNPKKSLLPPVKEPEKEQPRNTTFRQHSLCSKPASAPISQGQVESLDLRPPQATPRCLPSFPGGVRRDLVTHSGLSPLVSDWRPSLPTMTAEEMGRNPFLCQPVWH